MQTPGKLSISRVSSSQSGAAIRIVVRDDRAKTDFLSIQMSLADFAGCVTGLSFTPCTLDVSHLDRVGKQFELDWLEFTMPDNCGYGLERKKMARQMAKDLAPEGWIPDLGFDSQDSFTRTGNGKTIARTAVRRWVDADTQPSSEGGQGNAAICL